MLATEQKIAIYGLEKTEELKNNSNIVHVKGLQDAVNSAEIIIAPMPFSKDGKEINARYTENKISLSEFVEKIKDKTVIAGAITKDIKEEFVKNQTKVFDLMDYEELTVLNTIATAEGAIQVAMEKTEKIIHGSKVLILGLGRVGKTTAQKFAGLSAKITCAVRKPQDFAWAEVYGYDAININTLGENLKQYDIIINTPPTLILTKERLKHVKNDCLIIDLASKPGGVDFDACKEMGINFDWALALPGKVAPVTTAEHIKITIDNILKKL